MSYPLTDYYIKASNCLQQEEILQEPSAPEDVLIQIEELLEFMESEKIRELNVAGPRASEESEAYDKARIFLQLFLSALRKRE